MDRYDYYEAIYNDVYNYCDKNNIDFYGYYNREEELAEKLIDKLYNEDSITGNASGSYTSNTVEAEENLCHNLNLLVEACEAIGESPAILFTRGAELCDVLIRCYLLDSVIEEIIDTEMSNFEEEINA